MKIFVGPPDEDPRQCRDPGDFQGAIVQHLVNWRLRRPVTRTECCRPAHALAPDDVGVTGEAGNAFATVPCR